MHAGVAVPFLKMGVGFRDSLDEDLFCTGLVMSWCHQVC